MRLPTAQPFVVVNTEDADPVSGQPMLRSGELLVDLLLSLTSNMPASVV